MQSVAVGDERQDARSVKAGTSVQSLVWQWEVSLECENKAKGEAWVAMGAKADYTLAEAVAMVNFISTQISQHEEGCEVCCSTLEQFCEDGERIWHNRLKWRRRCKYAASREGVIITV